MGPNNSSQLAILNVECFTHHFDLNLFLKEDNTIILITKYSFSTQDNVCKALTKFGKLLAAYLRY